MVVICVPRKARAGDRLDAARKQTQSSSSSGGGGGFLEGLAAVAEAIDDDDDNDYGQTRRREIPPQPIRMAPSEPPRSHGFLAYPYAEGQPGFMVHTEPGDELPEHAQEFALRVGAEGAFLYDDVWRAGSNLTVMLPNFYTRFGYDLMLEGPTPRLDGDIEVSGTVRDRLHFARLEFGPQLAPEEMFAARLGLVGTLMFDDQRSLPVEPTMVPGVGVSLEFELYPVRPLVITARGGASKLGGATMLEGRLTAGVMIRRFEIYAGYDHRLIGNVPLGGPTLGVAARF